MRGSKLGLLATIALVAGVAGCSLPEVLPLEGGTSSGPSPYGPWYEQHWATNSVLLAAADQSDEDVDFTPEERAAIDAALAEDAEAQQVEAAEAQQVEAAEKAVNVPVEAASAPAYGEAVDFDNSSPYQFPSSAFTPPPPPAAVPPEPARIELTPPPLAAPGRPTTTPAPASDGPIRY